MKATGLCLLGILTVFSLKLAAQEYPYREENAKESNVRALIELSKQRVVDTLVSGITPFKNLFYLPVELRLALIEKCLYRWQELSLTQKYYSCICLMQDKYLEDEEKLCIIAKVCISPALTKDSKKAFIDFLLNGLHALDNSLKYSERVNFLKFNKESWETLHRPLLLFFSQILDHASVKNIEGSYMYVYPDRPMHELLPFRGHISSWTLKDGTSYTELISYASKWGNAIAVKTLIQLGFQHDNTAIDTLLFNGYIYDVIRIVNKNKESINFDTIPFRTVRKYANHPQYYVVMKHLLDLKLVNINKQDETSWTPLHHLLVFPCSSSQVKTMCDLGADVTAVDDEGLTPLHEALGGTMYREQKELEGTLALIRYINTLYPSLNNLPPSLQDLSLALAVINENKGFLESCKSDQIQQRIELVNGCTLAHIAAKFRKARMLKFLIKQGVDPWQFDEAYHELPLHSAARLGYKEIVALLLADLYERQQANPQRYRAENTLDVFFDGNGGESGTAPLFYAVQNGDYDIVKLLLAAGADPLLQEDGETLLANAQDQDIKALLEEAVYKRNKRLLLDNN